MSQRSKHLRWRFSADQRDRSGTLWPVLDVDHNLHRNPTMVDELVIGNWLHLEAMDDRGSYWLRVGGWVHRICVKGGKVQVSCEWEDQRLHCPTRPSHASGDQDCQPVSANANQAHPGASGDGLEGRDQAKVLPFPASGNLMAELREAWQDHDAFFALPVEEQHRQVQLNLLRALTEIESLQAQLAEATAERDELLTENLGMMLGDRDATQAGYSRLQAERDRLQAEVERLRAEQRAIWADLDRVTREAHADRMALAAEQEAHAKARALLVDTLALADLESWTLDPELDPDFRDEATRIMEQARALGVLQVDRG